MRTDRLSADNAVAGPYLSAIYVDSASRYASGHEQRASQVSLRPGRCDVHGLAGLSTNYYEGPCRLLRSPAGREVFDAPSDRLVAGNEAYAVLEGTLVRLEYVGLGEPELLAYFDALRPVDPDEIDFKGP